MASDSDPHSADQSEPIVLNRREFLAVGAGVAIGAGLPLGCSGDKGGVSTKDAPAVAAAQAAQGMPWEGMHQLADLVETVHLADLDHFGEFIDFGTAGRFKYTMGGWMTGFGNDTAMNGVTFTWATTSPARVYFSVPAPTALSFIVRARKGGTDTFSFYLNDKPLTRVSLGPEWSEHRIEATAERVIAGENLIKLVYTGGEMKIGGENAAFALNYLRIIKPGTDLPAGQFDPPRLDAIKGRHKAGDQERLALVLSAPTTLSYYAEVPASANLCFVAAPLQGSDGKFPNAAVSVKLQPVDAAAPIELLNKPISGEKWQPHVIDLSAAAGKLARIDVTVTGVAGGRVALGDVALRMAPPKIEIISRKAKNAIMLLIDTQRADKLTSYAKTRVRSPVMERFSAEATLFENCHSVSNWTKPACASVLTGLYPDTHKARGHVSVVPQSVKLASEIFLEAGYATGGFIANGYLAAEFGFKRGWTQYVNFIRENKPTEADKVFKAALEFIQTHKDSKPFFTYVQTIDPHVPYDPPDEYLKLYDKAGYEGPVINRSTGNLLEEIKRGRVQMTDRDRERLKALYDGEVTFHDTWFGHFLDGLRKLGVLDDTVISVCADHGEEFFEHDSVGHGHTLYQELIHVPLAFRAPGIFPTGRRLKSPAGLADVLPTVLAAVGIEPPKALEGRSLLPICNGAPADPFDATFSSFYSEADERNLSWAVRRGDFKLLMRGPARTVLSNLREDPLERTDVDERYPIALRALRILHGQFVGAPDKGSWTSGQIAVKATPKPHAKEEQTAVPEDLKAQLRALGYMQ